MEWKGKKYIYIGIYIYISDSRQDKIEVHEVNPFSNKVWYSTTVVVPLTCWSIQDGMHSLFNLQDIYVSFFSLSHSFFLKWDRDEINGE